MLERLLHEWGARRQMWTLRALARRWWWVFVKGHDGEICHVCGGPVMNCTGSWWRAPDDLWQFVVGSPTTILCPPCFATMAWMRCGMSIYWLAVAEAA